MEPQEQAPKVVPVAIYLAGPMLDYTGDFHHHAAKDWREEISTDLPPNVLLFSPAHAFFGCSPVTAPALDRIERYTMTACDGILVNLTENEPAFGSIRDIEFGRMQQKPVAVAGAVKSLMAHDLIVRPTLDEAFEALLFAVADQRNMSYTMFGFPMLRLERAEEE